MDFRYDDDDSTILDEAQQTLRRFLPRERFFHGSEAVGDWRSVTEGGWLHAGLPEDLGGAGLPLHIVAGIAKEAGAVLAGDAFVNNAVILPHLVAASTDAAAALAEHGATGGFLVADGRTRSLASTASGTTPWCFGVEDGFAAYSFDGRALTRHAPGSFAFSNLGEVALGVGEVVTGEGVHIADVAHPVDVPTRALIAHAASLVGLGESALDDTRQYVLERNQFGGPIGRFQAIKHELADIATELEIAWYAVLYASLRPDEQSALIALFQASRAAMRSVRAMIQFFGGIGVTIEHHAHLVLKTAATSSRRFGSQGAHAASLARHLLGAAS